MVGCLTVIRWLLFIPAGLVTGTIAFAIVAATLTGPIPRGDKDLLSFGGVTAELLGGVSSVLVGMFVAPRGARIVAGIIMDGACVVLAAIVAYVGWGVNDPGIRIYPLIGGVIYSSSAVITSIVFGRLDAARQRQKRGS